MGKKRGVPGNAREACFWRATTIKCVVERHTIAVVCASILLVAIVVVAAAFAALSDYASSNYASVASSDSEAALSA